MDIGTVKRKRENAETLLAASFEPTKAVSDSEKISEINPVEKNYEASETTEIAVNQANFVIKEEAIEWEETSLAKVKHEPTSPLPINTKSDVSDESNEDVTIKDATISLTRYPKAQNSVAKTRRRKMAPRLNRHAVYSYLEETNKADEFSKQDLNRRGKSGENFKKSAASSPLCIEEEVRREHMKQNCYQLEMCKEKSNSSGESHFRSQLNEKRSKEEMQNSSSAGSSSKQSKEQKETRKPFNCNSCSRCFQSVRALEDHERIHTGDKPFQCTLCNKTCTTKRNLVEHMRVHSEERPYKCLCCEKTFKRSFELKSHMRIHSGEKPFDCIVCGKSFAHGNNLKKHVRTHTGERPYMCTECGRAFCQFGDLTKHMRIHNGEKPYKCNECGNAFTRSYSLTKHKRVHTGECSFACSDCGSRFSTLGNLRRHIACRHGAASPVYPGTA